MASRGLISHSLILTDSQDAPECLCGSVPMPEGSKVCGGPIAVAASSHGDPRGSEVMGMGPPGVKGSWFTTPAPAPGSLPQGASQSPPPPPTPVRPGPPSLPALPGTPALADTTVLFLWDLSLFPRGCLHRCPVSLVLSCGGRQWSVWERLPRVALRSEASKRRPIGPSSFRTALLAMANLAALLPKITHKIK